MVEDVPDVARNRMPVLAAVCLAALVLPLSFSGGAVATISIGRDLGGSPIALNWITNAFMLTFGSSRMASGAFADQFGRKRLFTIGIGALTILSLASSLAPSVIGLDCLRAAQGFAAAAALAGGSAALAREFEGQVRTRAFSALGSTFGIGLAFGPLLAGLLIAAVGWRAVFLSSAGIGGLALLVGIPRMHESRDPDAARFDWPGATLFTGTLTLFTFGVILAPDRGWDSPFVLSLLLCSILVFAAFIVVEIRSTRPMLDLSLFGYARFVGVQIPPIATCCCYVVLLVMLPLRFIGIEGRSPLEAGILLVTLSAPMLVVPRLAATLTRWFSAGTLSGLGFLIASAGLFMLGRVDPAQSDSAALLPMLTIGTGAGLPWGLIDGLSVSVVPKERAGMATGIFNTTRAAGEGIALASVTAILGTFVKANLTPMLQVGRGPMAEAAQRLAAGDVTAAADALPALSRHTLVKAYASAFQELSYLLVAITAVSAIAALALLRRPETRDRAS